MDSQATPRYGDGADGGLGATIVYGGEHLPRVQQGNALGERNAGGQKEKQGGHSGHVGGAGRLVVSTSTQPQVPACARERGSGNVEQDYRAGPGRTQDSTGVCTGERVGRSTRCG